MVILASPSPSASPDPRFAPPPWHDDDPRRLELAQRLPDEHLARRIEQAVGRLDLNPLWQAYAGVGSLPHSPALLLRAVLYETQRGQHSPALWHRDARECEPLRWLLRGAWPSRSCWYAFRDRIAPVLDELNRQVLHQAVAQEFTPAQRGSLDGTLVAANASRHKLVNETTLIRRIEQLATADAPAPEPPLPADVLASAFPPLGVPETPASVDAPASIDPPLHLSTLRPPKRRLLPGPPGWPKALRDASSSGHGRIERNSGWSSCNNATSRSDLPSASSGPLSSSACRTPKRWWRWTRKRSSVRFTRCRCWTTWIRR